MRGITIIKMGLIITIMMIIMSNGVEGRASMMNTPQQSVIQKINSAAHFSFTQLPSSSPLFTLDYFLIFPELYYLFVLF